MRTLFALSVFIAVVVATGCAHKQEAVFKPVAGAPSKATVAPAPAPTPAPPATTAKPSSSLIVTPGSGLTGKVARYNDAGRFVVLEFPIGHLPALEQRFFVYRGGLKVGEVKITGPQKDDHIVADLTNGAAQAGDEVRDK